MSESPRDTANRLKARMMYEGYTPTDQENEFLILMARRDAMADEVTGNRQMMCGADGEQFKSMGLHNMGPMKTGNDAPVLIVEDVVAGDMSDEVVERLDERGKRPPIGRIVTAGYIGSDGAMHHALLQMMAAGATYPVTMEMTQADIEARMDIAEFGRLNHDVTLTVDMPPSMGKTMATLVDKRMLTRPAFAPEGNRADRRAGGHTKAKQRLKGLR